MFILSNFHITKILQIFQEKITKNNYFMFKNNYFLKNFEHICFFTIFAKTNIDFYE